MRISEKLSRSGNLDKKELVELLSSFDGKDLEIISEEAIERRKRFYGDKIFLRGLLEISNYCKNDCYYCGIRRSSTCVKRYRLDKEKIVSEALRAPSLGLGTVVLQGGEDPWYDDETLSWIIREIKGRAPEIAITLSLGERSKESYEKLFESGADRYLLRQESITRKHYRMLHPESQKIEDRVRCLMSLKEIGYQVGAGFMVGSPFQSDEDIANDILFIKHFGPHMVGIGPFIHAEGTPFEKMSDGSLEKTLLILGVVRIMNPAVLLPATTALSALSPEGRDEGLKMGANVIMPNITPRKERKEYNLYEGKPDVKLEDEEHIKALVRHLEKLGYKVDGGRGDSLVG